MRKEDSIWHGIDWPTVALFYTLVTMGVMNIYAAIYDPEIGQSIFDLLDNKAGSQFLWIIISTFTIILIMAIDFKFYFAVPYLVFGATLVLLILVLFIGTEIKGNQSWIKLGSMSFQPAEFAKLGVALAVAKYIDSNQVKYDLSFTTFQLLLIIISPIVLIMLQPDTGSALVFSSLIIMLYRDGLTPVIPALGIYTVLFFVLTLIFDINEILIGLAAITAIFVLFLPKNAKNFLFVGIATAYAVGIVFGTNYFVYNVLKDHQQKRIEALIDPERDPKGAGWNIIQSKIAIGSGGATGKGYMKGNITKFDFVPEQHTDFIFCTIGEEHGWVGSLFVISIYMALLLRLVFLAERQKSKFVKVYGYCVVSILFFHFMINIGMTIGLAPVIGIPLPFFSYGGSSLWAFTILLFIFVKLDMHRGQMLTRS